LPSSAAYASKRPSGTTWSTRFEAVASAPPPEPPPPGFLHRSFRVTGSNATRNPPRNVCGGPIIGGLVGVGVPGGRFPPRGGPLNCVARPGASWNSTAGYARLLNPLTGMYTSPVCGLYAFPAQFDAPAADGAIVTA